MFESVILPRIVWDLFLYFLLVQAIYVFSTNDLGASPRSYIIPTDFHVSAT